MQNTLFTGDNLYILYGMNSESVDLIYLDPPFNSKRTYSAPVGSKAAGASFKDMWSWEDIDDSYLDKLTDKHPFLVKFIQSIEGLHSKAMMAYVTYMTQRIIEMHRVLKPTGSIYFHCDPTASHYIKNMLDEVFGRDNFRNEIVWAYRKWTNAATYFQKNHDIILSYVKNREKTFFNKIYDTPTDSQQKVIKKGYNVNKVANGLQLLVYNKKIVDNLIAKGKIDPLKYIKIVDQSESEGTAMNDVWNIQYLHSQAKERTGYPTQKPLALLDRIIKASCPEDGVVLDPFCGCATTCVATELLNFQNTKSNSLEFDAKKRTWIGIDIEKQAVTVLVDRLKEAQGELFKNFAHRLDIPKRTDIVEEIVTQGNKKSIKDRILKQQNGCCNGCMKVFDIWQFEIDHMVPKAKGGGDYFENYQLLCPSCNRIKGDRTMEYLRIKIRAREELLRDKITFGG